MCCSLGVTGGYQCLINSLRLPVFNLVCIGWEDMWELLAKAEGRVEGNWDEGDQLQEELL